MDRLVHSVEQDRLVYSRGYCGHGVQMATRMGKQMAEVVNGVTDPNPWRDFALKRIPGPSGHRGSCRSRAPVQGPHAVAGSEEPPTRPSA